MERYIHEDRARHFVDELLVRPNINAICSIIKKYDEALFIHCIDVAFISAQIALAMKFPDIWTKEIVAGALVHDVGKTKIPKSIIDKPGKLTPEEYGVVKLHPLYGYEIVQEYELSEIAADIVLHHHEDISGTGYPHGSTDIDIETKMVSVADKYDAITSQRVYKNSCDKYTAFAKMGMFQPNFASTDVIYQALTKCHGI